MLCKQCHQEIPDSATYCAYCGAATAETAVEQTPRSVAQNPVQPILPAPTGKRFINYIGDRMVMYVISKVVGMGALQYYVLGDSGYAGSWLVIWIVSWILFPFAYYFITEALWSKSPAKFLTKTKVVTETGERPTSTHIFMRSLIRLIPFEQFSFLFGVKAGRPRGWHDRWSHTLVIEDK